MLCNAWDFEGTMRVESSPGATLPDLFPAYLARPHQIAHHLPFNLSTEAMNLDFGSFLSGVRLTAAIVLLQRKFPHLMSDKALILNGLHSLHYPED